MDELWLLYLCIYSSLSLNELTTYLHICFSNTLFSKKTTSLELKFHKNSLLTVLHVKSVLVSIMMTWCQFSIGFLTPGVSFKGLEVITETLQNSFLFSNFNDNIPIRSQICTWHARSAVVTCAKWWPDLVNIFHQRVTHISIQFGSWAHKLHVKWIIL